MFSRFSSLHVSFLAPNMKIVELANHVDPDEVAHREPPHLGLYCLPSSVLIFNMIQLR